MTSIKKELVKKKVGTKEFAQAVISNLGETPSKLKPVSYAKETTLNLPKYVKKPKRTKS